MRGTQVFDNMSLTYILVSVLLFVLVVTSVLYLKKGDVQDVRKQIILEQQGFQPSELTVKKGSTVTFTTTAARQFWPASNLHPSHDIYPDFDAKRPLESDEVWSFTFNTAGDWPFHDHIRSYYVGVVHVIE
ncbi:MAG: Uncharacterized protein G01um10148_353 [Parcubacteria group bacterium Gr01-1014_8]|nr:MAG: Uncharacterized protein G01um10148_353 [Parcubacteria group bacterium Gr01-1014_8]